MKCRMPRGSAAVELALVLPLLLTLVLGALDWGYYFFVAQVVTNATREGARAGSLHEDDAGASGDASAAAANYLQLNGLDPSKATITVTPTADAVRVQIDYPAGSLTGLVGLVVPARAQGRAEMRR